MMGEMDKDRRRCGRWGVKARGRGAVGSVWCPKNTLLPNGGGGDVTSISLKMGQHCSLNQHEIIYMWKLPK